jgi:hypothetical protein
VSEPLLSDLLVELNNTLNSFRADREYVEKIGVAASVNFMVGREQGAKHIIKIVERFLNERTHTILSK